MHPQPPPVADPAASRTGAARPGWTPRRLGLALGLLFALIQAVGLFEVPERALMTLRLGWRGPVPAPESIVIVALDEAALARWGRLPWDRRLHARLIDHLGQAGARAVGLDVAFNEPSRDPAEDGALEAALRRNGRVVMPAYRAQDAHGATSLYRPVPRLERAAAGLGLVQFSTAAENVIFRYDPQQTEGEALLPTFGAALARLSGHRVAPHAHGYLNPLGPAHHFKTISAAEAFETPPEAFHDKVVLVGATARGMPDTNFAWAYPSQGPISGVELHATALANLTTGHLLRRLPSWLLAALLVALGLGPGAWLLRSVARRRWHPTVGLLAVVVAIAAASQALLWASWWLDVAAPIALLASCHVLGLGWREMALLADRNQLLDRYARDLDREARRERQRIDGELHDEAQQLVIALQRELRRGLKRLPDKEGTVTGPLRAASEIAQQLFDEILRVRRDLVPRQLESAGLNAALEALVAEVCHRHPTLDVALECDDLERLAPDQEAELYWLVKEALNNALKHAQARRLRIGLARHSGGLQVRFQDDGQGFVVPDYHREPQGVEHSGLHRMWLRARAWGGDLEIRSQPGQGTAVIAQVPLKGAQL